MRRTSIYFELKFVVQVRWPVNTWFETIAAFNSEQVAKRYAADCAKNNPQLSYRVLTRNRYGRWD